MTAALARHEPLLMAGPLEHAALGNNNNGGGPFDVSSYEALKHRVQQLKREQQSVAKGRAAATELESAALLQQRQQHEAAQAALHAEVASLREQLRSSTERAAKVRQKLEKEKRALQVQVEGFDKELEARDSEHDKALTQLQSQHDKAMAEVMQQLQGEQQGREEDRRAFEKARDAAVAEAGEWCEGEIEAVRHVLSKQLESSQQEVQRWQAQCHQLEDRVQGQQAEIAEAHGAAEQLEAQVQGLEEQLEAQRQQGMQQAQQLDRERSGRQADSQQAAQDQAQQAESLKALHREQLSLVAQRLEQVVARKDGTIAALKAELQRVTDKLRKFEGLLVFAGDARGAARGL